MANIFDSYYPIDHKIYNTELNLKNNDFIGQLYNQATNKCKEFLPNNKNIKMCQRDLMIASSCVLLRKANVTIGDLRDHIGDCRFEIELSQKNLIQNYENFPTKRMDNWIRELSLSTKTFA